MNVMDGPVTCPNCGGEGVVTITKERTRKFLEGLDHWAALREKSNGDLAGCVSEIENYLRQHDLSPVVLQWLQEVWWRLHAAEEPIAETQRKIDALSNDPIWLDKE